MLPWKTIIKIDKKNRIPIYLQIVDSFIKEIRQGRVIAGEKLPGTRVMARLLNLNRKTIVIAYDELMAQGWIEIKPSKGTFVSGELPLLNYRKLHGEIENRVSISGSTGFDIKQKIFLKDDTKSGPYDHIIDDGTPDIRLAPLGELMKNMSRIARTPVYKKLFKYSDPKGTHSLREVLVDYLRETRGLIINSENIFISRGSQMAIYLIFNVLLYRDGVVVVGETNYPVTDQVILNFNGEIIKVPVDQKGVKTKHIASICKRTKIRAVYITPHHHFPTTVTLSAKRRLELLDLAKEYNFAIVEDDYDYDFHYKSSPILPLASLDTDGVVIYTGSFSKLLAPAVRVGYVVAPKNLIDEISRLRRIIDRQGDTLLESALADMIRMGELTRHLKKTLRAYKKRRDLFCKLLRDKLNKYVQFRIPDGGMAVWVIFNEKINIIKLSDKLRSKGFLMNVDFNFVDSHNGIRIGFASLNEEEIVHTVNILGQTISDL